MSKRSGSTLRALTLAAVLASTGASAQSAPAGPSLEDYRYLRALSVDLGGQMPAPADLAALEAATDREQFFSSWIDQHLAGASYAERLRRLYMDLMRLRVGTSFQFVPSPITLRRVTLTGPDGHPVEVWFRRGQRRARYDTDGDFCLALEETGYHVGTFKEADPPDAYIPATRADRASLIAHYAQLRTAGVSQANLDRYTRVVYPWWLYRDYTAANPTQLYNPTDAANWAAGRANYRLSPGLVNHVDGAVITPRVTVRVCAEEAAPYEDRAPLTQRTGTGPGSSTWAVDGNQFGRDSTVPAATPPSGVHAGDPIPCGSSWGFSTSSTCSCGRALERCLGGDGPGFDPAAFALPSQTPVGDESPAAVATGGESEWSRFWWGQEAEHFIDYVFGAPTPDQPHNAEHPITDLLTARYGVINGPLAQFYRSTAPTTCCSSATQFMGTSSPGSAASPALFDPASVPASLLPSDVREADWRVVTDRGALASGLLTMPVFLTKYGTRRARAHVLYNAFLCRDFVAGNVPLTPSTEPNLMLRPGCSSCHATLEPLAAYFTRVVESDWTWLPGGVNDGFFPLQSAACHLPPPAADGGVGVLNYGCRNYYDPAFASGTQSLLRGSYASNEHSQAGPSGIAAALSADPAFPACVANNIASSFLGRTMGPDDDALMQQLTAALTSHGMHASALVRALVLSDEYRHGNDLSAAAWRSAHGATP